MMSRFAQPNDCNLAWTPASFFLLRTPLLPFDEIMRWGDPVGLPHSTSPDESHEPECACREEWKAHVTVLRDRLLSIAERDEVRRAICLASPSLDSSISYWQQDPESKRGLQTERALVRYVMRMSGRSTPFGLFAGCSTGATNSSGDQPCGLILGAADTYRSVTQLDYDVLLGVAAEVRCDAAIEEGEIYWANETIHHGADGIHYFETRMVNGHRSQHFSKILSSKALEVVLDRARTGATIDELSESLQQQLRGANISRESARNYVRQLVANDVLVSDLRPPLTGPQPVDGFIERLDSLPQGRMHATRLRTVRAILAELDANPVTAPLGEFRSRIANLKASLNTSAQTSDLLQVELHKPLDCGCLPPVIGTALAEAADVLLRLGHEEARHSPTQAALREFREAFSKRFGQAWVPLLEAVDEITGIPFGTTGSSQDTSPLLRDIPSDDSAGPQMPPPRTYPLLLSKVVEWARTGASEIEIHKEELPWPEKDPPEIPDAFSLIGSIASESATALGEGRFSVYVTAGGAASSATVLGRFCHSNPELEDHLRGQLAAEEALDSDAVYAEIVFAPVGRAANLVCRPVLRQYEIVHSGCSGVSHERQIPASDLLLQVSDSGRVTLYSRRIDKRIIPRLASAHSFTKPGQAAAYRLLCSLQYQKAGGIPPFSWGLLESLSYLPRVRFGRSVLSCARWRLSKSEIESLHTKDRYDCFAAVRQLRRRRGLPRWILLVDGDNTLPVDLANPLSVDSFTHVIRRGGQQLLREMYPPPSQLVCSGPEGRYCHEMIFSLVRNAKQQASEPHSRLWTVSGRAKPTAIDRSFRMLSPGSDWLYAKLYGRARPLDTTVTDLLPCLADETIGRGLAKRWFFVRYSEPSTHLRVRFESATSKLGDLFDFLTNSFKSWLMAGRISKVEFDTYDREVERYGGKGGVVAAEAIFCADSEAVVRILAIVKGSPDLRWRAALLGAHRLLADCGLTLAERHELTRLCCKSFESEGETAIKKTRFVAERFRSARADLSALFAGHVDQTIALQRAGEILDRRSAMVVPAVQALYSLSKTEELRASIGDLVISYVHMHFNRMFEDRQRIFESVLYAFLCRLYDSELNQRRNQPETAGALSGSP